MAIWKPPGHSSLLTYLCYICMLCSLSIFHSWMADVLQPAYISVVCWWLSFLLLWLWDYHVATLQLCHSPSLQQLCTTSVIPADKPSSLFLKSFIVYRKSGIWGMSLKIHFIIACSFFSSLDFPADRTEIRFVHESVCISNLVQLGSSCKQKRWMLYMQ